MKLMKVDYLSSFKADSHIQLMIQMCIRYFRRIITARPFA